jgi:hypothetical protein
MEEILRRQKAPLFLAKFLLIRYYLPAAICQRAHVDESGISQMGTHNTSENSRSALYVTTP